MRFPREGQVWQTSPARLRQDLSGPNLGIVGVHPPGDDESLVVRNTQQGF